MHAFVLFALLSNFCFACFASQTPGLCTAFPSAPAVRWTLLLLAIYVLVLCLTNTGFVQCYSLGSRKVCCMLVFIILLYSVIFCFACFASQTLGLCSAFPSAPVVCCTLFLLVIHVLCSLAHHHRVLCSAFPFGSPRVYTPLFFSVLLSLLLLCVFCPTSSGLCSDFFPGSLRICTLIFCPYYSVFILSSAFFPSLT